MTKPAGKFFYGWIIVAVCLLALIVSNGLSIGGIPVFYKFVQNELVANGSVPQDRIQSVYGYAPAITFFLAGFFGLLSGFLLKRVSAKMLMIAGCFILGGGVLIYSQASSVAFVYLAHAMLGSSLAFVGVIVCTVLVSSWFDKRRGTALGVVLTGTSFGGVIIPQLATPLIQAYGWRVAMAAVSLLVWAVLLPAVIFLIKDRPSDFGSFVDGDVIEFDESAMPVERSGVTLVEALKTPIFWIFGITAALIFYAIFVVTQQLNLYLQSPKMGFSPSQAAGVQSLIFTLSIAGKFIYGFLSDRFPISKVMLVSAAALLISTLTFLYFNNVAVYIFAALFGLNYGGMFVLLQLMVAEHFGVKDYGKILGAVIMIETVGASLGPIITAKIADADGGDYTRAFYSLILVTLLAFLATLVIDRFYRRKYAATESFAN